MYVAGMVSMYESRSYEFRNEKISSNKMSNVVFDFPI